MIILQELQSPAIVRSFDHPSLRREARFSMQKTMFGTMVYPTAAETKGNYENEGVTVKREYSGHGTYGKYKVNTNEPQSCQQILSNEEDAGEIPAGESCSCPPGAKTPQCYNDDSQVCQELLQYDQSDTKLQYDDCSCSEGSSQPTCTPYYQLCEDNLPSYEADYPDDECSCSNPTKSATPNCISYYQLCEENLPTAQADNPDDECWCDDPQTNATPHCESDYDICESAEEQDIEENPYQECSCPAGSTTPSCESYYDICESNASQYENSNTSCTCSQTSVDPTCCSTNTTQVCSTENSTTDGITVEFAKDGVGAIFCSNSSYSTVTENPNGDGAGPTCPASSGITVCAYGVCRSFGSSGGSMAGFGDSYDKSNPSTTYSPFGSYWDWGYCDGPTQAGSCANGGWFTIFEGPTAGLNNTANYILRVANDYPIQTTVCHTKTSTACVVE